jgi:hypothetical protein
LDGGAERAISETSSRPSAGLQQAASLTPSLLAPARAPLCCLNEAPCPPFTSHGASIMLQSACLRLAACGRAAMQTAGRRSPASASGHHQCARHPSRSASSTSCRAPHRPGCCPPCPGVPRRRRAASSCLPAAGRPLPVRGVSIHPQSFMMRIAGTPVNLSQNRPIPGSKRPSPRRPAAPPIGPACPGRFHPSINCVTRTGVP